MRALRIAALAAVTLSAVTASAAVADPPAGLIPPTTSIVAVGSNTTQSLFDKWSTDYNATNPADTFYSFDDTGTSPIHTKNDPACANLARAHGASNGVAELNAGTRTADGNYCVDAAQSARQLTAADGPVSSVLFAHDAMGWAATNGGNAPTNLTIQQLTAIYNCTDTKWTQVGGTSTATIVPVLPWYSSDTRITFLQDINVLTPGTCVRNADGDQAIQENEGTNAVFTGTNAPNVLVPFSIGSYISQVDLGTSTNAVGNLTLRSTQSITPTTGTGTSTI
ncbi:MAG TPA: substrate-binding domain-containing protein, partial [Pseudonocardiaceae bacterium]|nr:substrate-binding domain-containing protein [Pseudonocardiaceae bacterium]